MWNRKLISHYDKAEFRKKSLINEKNINYESWTENQCKVDCRQWLHPAKPKYKIDYEENNPFKSN